jgi:glycosyltransferase involved in cell wall biosynthesis
LEQVVAIHANGMRIAQVAPLFECVPPTAYGGTERVISYLTEELVRQGHDVTLFASGESTTAAHQVSIIQKSMRLSGIDLSWLAYHIIQLDQVSQLAHDFDVIHFHTDYLHFPTAKYFTTPHLSTLHGRLDLPELLPLYRHFSDMPLVSISNSQRRPLPWVNWLSTIYHGLPPDLYSFEAAPSDYFVFIGRISPEKRIDRAIDIAIQCDRPLYIGAKIDKADETYFNDYIKPLICHPLVSYVGEVSQKDKRKLLEQASALLFPIDWPEPFGLVMIEAFACGTPVIAYANGSVPEIMEDSVTGFIVTNQKEAVHAARRIDSIDRRGCRDVFERRFTAVHMANHYLQAYQRLLFQ